MQIVFPDVIPINPGRLSSPDLCQDILTPEIPMQWISIKSPPPLTDLPRKSENAILGKTVALNVTRSDISDETADLDNNQPTDLMKKRPLSNTKENEPQM